MEPPQEENACPNHSCYQKQCSFFKYLQRHQINCSKPQVWSSYTTVWRSKPKVRSLLSLSFRYCRTYPHPQKTGPFAKRTIWLCKLLFYRYVNTLFFVFNPCFSFISLFLRQSMISDKMFPTLFSDSLLFYSSLSLSHPVRYHPRI